MNRSESLKARRLDTIGARVYAFLARRIGYTSTPKDVPLYLIAKAIGISYKQARIRIDHLIEMGLLEKWTSKHNTQFKITYYRLTYSDISLEREKDTQLQQEHE